ncbi:hypothetical protein, partial [Mesorhizobium sp.]|uniref:hypothetical protein n=1 Tax=Mesorhizobium sp. TaxID=1871066 RepID=UPI00345469F7
APFAAFAFRSRLELRAVEARLAGPVALVAAALTGWPIAGLATRGSRLAIACSLAVARTIVAAIVMAVARARMVEAR